jgi:hypothetical protein
MEKYLYHFTTKKLYRGIKSQGLMLGRIPTGIVGGKIIFLEQYQWLTANPDFNQEWCKYGTLPYKRNEVRLTIEIPESMRENLYNWMDVCKVEVSPKFEEALNLYGDPENWRVYKGCISPYWIKEVVKNNEYDKSKIDKREGDMRKAAYHSCLNLWQKMLNENKKDTGKPNYQAFGLTLEEAKDVEDNGYSLKGNPSHLTCDYTRELKTNNYGTK